jgi:hypothetical protein
VRLLLFSSALSPAAECSNESRWRVNFLLTCLEHETEYNCSYCKSRQLRSSQWGKLRKLIALSITCVHKCEEQEVRWVWRQTYQQLRLCRICLYSGAGCAQQQHWQQLRHTSAGSPAGRSLSRCKGHQGSRSPHMTPTLHRRTRVAVAVHVSLAQSCVDDDGETQDATENLTSVWPKLKPAGISALHSHCTSTPSVPRL